MATGLTAAWQGMQAVTGDRTMPKLKKAFGQYNAYEDPKFYQDWEMFEQNPNPQRAKLILDEYGDSLEIEDQAQLVNMIKPMEGTPQGQEYRNDLLAGDIKSEELKTLQERDYGQLSGELKLSNAELGLDKNNLAAEEIDYDTSKLNYMQQQKPYESSIDAQISSNETNIMQNNMTQQEIEALLDEGVPEQKAATAIAQLEANEVQSLYNKLMNQNKVNDANKLYDLFIRSKIAGTETAESNATITGNRADISTATKEDEIQMVKDNAVLSRLEKELGLYSQPYRKQNVVYDNNIKGNQSDVSDLEGYKANKTLNYLQSIGEKELMTAMGLNGGTSNGGQNTLSPERIVGQTADGRNIYSGVGGGYITIDPRTGQNRSLTREEFDNADISTSYGEIMVDPFKILWHDIVARNTIGEDELARMASNGEIPRNMTLDQATKFINNMKHDFDISKILTSGSLAGEYRPETSLDNYIETGGQTNPTPQPQPGSTTTQSQNMGINNLIQTYKNKYAGQGYSAKEVAQSMEENLDPQEFKERTGQNLYSVTGRMRIMRWQ